MSWPQVEIASFCKTGSGGTPSRKKLEQYYNGTIPWVKSGELKDNIILDTEELITEKALKESSAKMIKKGSILIAMYGATIGNIATLGIDAATNQAVCNITPDESKVFPRFFYHALKNNVSELLTRKVGGAQPNISQGIINETKIPLPPLAEQKRIAAILDKADAIRRKRKRALELADEFLRSVFLDMFGDPVVNPRGWEVRLLSSLADITSGVTKGKKLNGQETVEISYMRVANVQDSRLDLAEVKTIDVTQKDADKYLLKKGDLLLTEGGDPDKLGRGAVWNEEVSPCIHQNHIFRVRLDTQIAIPEFASCQIGSPRGKRYFLHAAKQTTGIASINKTQLSNFPFIVPPLPIQKKFLSIHKKAKEKLDTISASSIQSEDLFASLSQRAFRGEL